MSIAVKMKLLNQWAQMPAYARPGDAGLDLRWCETDESMTIYVGETRVLWTALAIELPGGYEAQVRGRSSLSKQGVIASIGTIDSGYRGNIGVTLTNLSEATFKINRGDRIAQLVIQEIPRVTLVQVDALGDSERGADGWGSSGVR